MKQYYRINAGSLQKIQNVKIEKLQGQKLKNNALNCVVCDSKKSKFIKQ